MAAQLLDVLGTHIRCICCMFGCGCYLMGSGTLNTCIDVILVMLTCCRLFVWDTCPYGQSYKIWDMPPATLLFCGC